MHNAKWSADRVTITGPSSVVESIAMASHANGIVRMVEALHDAEGWDQREVQILENGRADEEHGTVRVNNDALHRVVVVLVTLCDGWVLVTLGIGLEDDVDFAVGRNLLIPDTDYGASGSHLLDISTIERDPSEVGRDEGLTRARVRQHVRNEAETCLNDDVARYVRR